MAQVEGPTASSLAVLGGEPAFSREIHVGRPNIADRAVLLRSIGEVLDSRWFTNDGPVVRELEARIAERLGVRHCLAMCNGTVALEIAIRALGLRGEVIVPSFTFVATAHALQWQEITPVFCDVDAQTHTLDPGRVEEMITPKTTGILATHLWGRPCDVAALQRIGDEHDLAVLYDAAHSFACTLGETPIGNFGRCEVFSFHATKFFNTLEGGAVCTNDDDLAERIRLMRNFGFAGLDSVIYIGTNGKMNEVSAAVGLNGLGGIEDFISINKQHFQVYQERLGRLPGLALVEPEAYGRSNFQYIVVEVGSECPLTRDELVAVLWAEGVRARRYFHPGVHRMEPYRTAFPEAGLALPVTERLTESVLVLPTGTDLDRSDVELITELVARAIAMAPAVRASMAKS